MIFFYCSEQPIKLPIKTPHNQNKHVCVFSDTVSGKEINLWHLRTYLSEHYNYLSFRSSWCAWSSKPLITPVLSEHAQSWCKDKDGDVCCLLIARLGQSLLLFCEVHFCIHSTFCVCIAKFCLSNPISWLCFPLFAGKRVFCIHFLSKINR